MKNKILAIGIPSYNGEPYLDRCIPTFIDDRIKDKIEVIIVNDGSKDNTKEIAEKYKELYPSTVKVINKENGGHGSAVNAALYSTSAKYYKVVDCDDWVDTDELVKLVKFLEANDVDIVSNSYNQVNMLTGFSEKIGNYGYEFGKVYRFEDINIKDLYLSIHSTTYKTSILKENNIKLQENTFYVDVEYQLLPIPYIKTIAFLDDCAYKYMVGNVNQSINIENFVNRYDDHNRVVHRILEFLKDAVFTKNQKDYVYGVFEKVLYTHYALSSIYDLNLVRGKERSSSFDAYLKETNPYLYDFMGKKYHIIKRLRKKDFNIKAAQNSKLRSLKRFVKGLIVR